MNSRRNPSVLISLSTKLLPVVTVCLFFGATVVAPGQSLPRRPVAEDHLEHMQDPPISIVPRRIETSAQLVSPFGPYTSYQVNVDANGNNIVGDAANEPSICVDPTNPNRMAIGWRQFNNVSSNFRQAGWGFTSDAGAHWTFPGILQNNVFRSDPVLNSDSSGKFYYLSLLNNFFDDLWRSVNGGQDWTDLGPATGGDKQWFTIDNTPSSPGRGFQYQDWSTAGNNYQGRQFSRSIDGGATWQNPVAIPQSPIWGTLDVDTNGNVFLSGLNTETGQIWCVRSSNAKNSAVKPSFDQVTPVNLGGDMLFSDLINPEGLVGQINLAIDKSGTSTNNNIYMLGSLQSPGVFNGSDIMFVRSTNGGQTFSNPIRINDDPVNPNKWHWFGALAVAPTGRIDCVWLDSRNGANNTDSQLFYSFSSDGGQTWAPNVPVSNLFNPFIGYPNQNKMGDYITVVSDNTGANVAYTATFNGEEDVYFIHIPASGCNIALNDVTQSIPTGWITQNNSGSGDTGWFQGDNTVFTGQSGAGYIAADFHSANETGTISNWLLTPAVTLQNGGKLTFFTRTVANPSHPDRLQVRMSTNGESANVGSTAESVGDFTTVLLDINPNYTTTDYPTGWTQLSANITGLPKPVIGRLAFRYFVENGGSGANAINSDYIGIDAVQFSCTASYNITLSSSPSGAGNLTGGGNYPSGANVTVMAAPNPNFTFSNWTENGSVVSASASYSFTASADRNLVANFAAVIKTAAAPVITPNGGTFKKKVLFKITDSTPGATIYYTTDGSDPTTSSAVFPKPAGKNKKVKKVTITGIGSHTVKAMAVAPGFNNSPIVTATFNVTAH